MQKVRLLPEKELNKSGAHKVQRSTLIAGMMPVRRLLVFIFIETAAGYVVLGGTMETPSDYASFNASCEIDAPSPSRSTGAAQRRAPSSR
jgi:hypothetical protein